MRIQLGPSKQRKATQEESQEDMEVHCVTPVGPRTEKALDKNHRNLNEDTWKFYIVPFSKVNLKFLIMIIITTIILFSTGEAGAG